MGCMGKEIVKYRGKLSGALVDRIDIAEEVSPID